MAIISVGEWVPDAASLGNPGSLVITNAVPSSTSYKPFPSFAVLTGALDARARGAIDVRASDGTVYQYAGDAAKLYVLSGTTWTDASLSGGYTTATDETWQMVKWKNRLLATNFTNNPQSITLGGTNFANMTTALRMRTIAVVRDYVVAGNTFDGTDGNVPDRVRWSAFNDETDWTVSPSTGADFRDLKGGPIQKILGGEYGIIFGRDSIFRMTFVGAPAFFQIDEVLPGIGLIGPNAVSRIGDTSYFLSEHGFVAMQGATGIEFIGANKVDRFIREDLDDAHLSRISCVADPRSGRVFWAYPGSGNNGGIPNKVIVYDRNLGRWSLIEEEVEILWRAGGVGFTLDQLDGFSASLDELAVSLDSSQWKGTGSQLLAAFNTSHRHGFFSGSAMPATIETKETEIHAGHKTRLNAFRPLVDGGFVTAQVGFRDRQTDTYTLTEDLNQSASGRFTKRVNARYHRFRLNLSGDWQEALGVQIEPHEARKAEKRG